MSPRPKLSTIGWSFDPIVLNCSISFNEVTIPDILSILLDCWVAITLNLGILEICVVHLVHWILVVTLIVDESVYVWVYIWGDCFWVFGHLKLITGSFMGFFGYLWGFL